MPLKVERGASRLRLAGNVLFLDVYICIICATQRLREDYREERCNTVRRSSKFLTSCERPDRAETNDVEF